MTDLSSLKPVVEARNLVLTFGRVVGLNHANLELYPGEVLAVIGDNGAGKSTLIKCLSGAYTPDSGEIFVDGQEVHFRNSIDSRSVGIETVYQRSQSHRHSISRPTCTWAARCASPDSSARSSASSTTRACARRPRPRSPDSASARCRT